MQRLCGSFSITNLENVANFGEAKAALLDNKKYLNKLELQWDNHENVDARRNEEVLAGLKPHRGLRELEIKNYGGLMFPSWLSDPSFHKLERIDIQKSQNCISLPAFGQLPVLKSLYIDGMRGLECIDSHFCGLGQPLSNASIIADEGLPTSLQNLIIMECDLLSVRCHVEEGEDWNKIKFIHNVEIDGYSSCIDRYMVV
ncbi:hypothetical protein FNV43_RR00214 [Rhamnella rubrinervis]|uniref:R13L1/DRL21-like LRR repeat region domain-containing protein n=1 Tax=Rhamnella rubrinervis TaxID=2594499 RepID=A0A8K0HMF2_9ROSA|nr:hypothetical protein FNV43_RR00214 [Rhamnella rubrinervis]